MFFFPHLFRKQAMPLTWLVPWVYCWTDCISVRMCLLIEWLSLVECIDSGRVFYSWDESGRILYVCCACVCTYIRMPVRMYVHVCMYNYVCVIIAANSNNKSRGAIGHGWWRKEADIGAKGVESKGNHCSSSFRKLNFTKIHNELIILLACRCLSFLFIRKVESSSHFSYTFSLI